MTATAETWRIPEFSRGERMAKAREDAGYTQETFAVALSERLGRRVKESTVGAWEAERNQPRGFMDVMEAWAELTRVPVQWLLTGSFATPLHLVPPMMGQTTLDEELEAHTRHAEIVGVPAI